MRLAQSSSLVLAILMVVAGSAIASSPADEAAQRALADVEGALPGVEADLPDTVRLLTPEAVEFLHYRNLGPFRAGAWVSDIEVPERPEREHRTTMYVATRNGGLWKTTNHGTTFEPLFDDQAVQTIGDVALSPSEPDIVWVGSGGADSARSAYAGNGVYRSPDGGETWEHKGLDDSHHIGRIVVHPENPDVVWVAAMGHLFSPNEQRGVFKTVDGGETWDQVLYLNEKLGAIDLVLVRDDPDTLYAAMYEQYRYPWHFEAGGPGSGIYKTIDGGDTWTRLGGGLPTSPTGTEPGHDVGRIGLDVFQADPRIVYAVVENVEMRSPTEEEAAADLEEGREPSDREIGGEVYRSDDAGATWVKANRVEDNVGGKAAYSFNQIRVAPDDDQRIYVTSICIASSEDGGRTWFDIDWPPRKVMPRMFGDVRTLWIDPVDPDRVIAGTDGGIHVSYDRGATSDFLHNLPLGEIYAVGIDTDDPYHVYAGLQDHESWRGPINSWSGEVGIEDWITVGIQDGMYNRVDPHDSRWLYNNYQFGGHSRVDQQTRTQETIVPDRAMTRPYAQGSGAGDVTAVPADDAANESLAERYRFTWITPIEISPHDTRTIYTGAELLLRSPDRGETWEEISPILACEDEEKIAGRGGIQYCTITSISESPIAPGQIWVGTDSGRVWVTSDGGSSWSEATSALAAAGDPGERWVTRVLASRWDAETAYVAKSGRKNDDFRALVFRTKDLGATWEPWVGGGGISSGTGSGPGSVIDSDRGRLPDRPVNVISEDPVDRDLLYLGNDMGVFVSLDAGMSWGHLKANMPNVPVHDLVVHPREHDLVAGTYGRGIWVTDIAHLRELDGAVLEADLHLFEIAAAALRLESGWGNYDLYGDRHIVTPNEPNGAVIVYRVSESLAAEAASGIGEANEVGWASEAGAEEDPAGTGDGGEAAGHIMITDAQGEVVASFEVPGGVGWHRVVWPLGGARRPTVAPGTYQVKVEIGSVTASSDIEVREPVVIPR